MQPLRFSTKLVALALIATVLFASTSCGTLLYPERRGQPRGVIDSGVVLLDAIGLIFFVVPGLVAFAVDFSTGAIYFPPPPNGPSPSYAPMTQNEFRREDLVKVQVPKEELSRAKIEQVVSQRTGQSVALETGRFRAAEISDLDEFGAEAARLGGPATVSPPTAVRFR
jgi:hypothetical protein